MKACICTNCKASGNVKLMQLATYHGQMVKIFNLVCPECNNFWSVVLDRDENLTSETEL